MDSTDCLWASSRSSDQLQRRRAGRTWTCCSVEPWTSTRWRLADHSWLQAATFATGVQKSDRYRGAEWRRQRNIMVPSLNLTRCGTLSQWSSLRKISVSRSATVFQWSDDDTGGVIEHPLRCVDIAARHKQKLCTADLCGTAVSNYTQCKANTIIINIDTRTFWSSCSVAITIKEIVLFCFRT